VTTIASDATCGVDRDAVQALVERSRSAQGLPSTIEDASVLAELAASVRAAAPA
jgi:hypothetical protein